MPGEVPAGPPAQLVLEVLGQSPVLHRRPAEAETGGRCRDESRSCRSDRGNTQWEAPRGPGRRPLTSPPVTCSLYYALPASGLVPLFRLGVLLAAARDKPLFHDCRESCRQRRGPSKQQVASQHPVIKESVNTAALAPILTGSLLIHVPDRKILFLDAFEVHASIRFQGPGLK